MAIFKVLSEINLSLYSLFGKKIGFDRSFFKKISLHSIFGKFFRFERNKFISIPYLAKKLNLHQIFSPHSLFSNFSYFEPRNYPLLLIWQFFRLSQPKIYLSFFIWQFFNLCSLFFTKILQVDFNLQFKITNTFAFDLALTLFVARKIKDECLPQ